MILIMLPLTLSVIKHLFDAVASIIYLLKEDVVTKNDLNIIIFPALIDLMVARVKGVLYDTDMTTHIYQYTQNNKS